MSNFKKSAVKNQRILRLRVRTHLGTPQRQPDASGYAFAGPEPIGTSPSPFATDYFAEHTIADISSPPTANLIGSTGCQEPQTSKSAQS